MQHENNVLASIEILNSAREHVNELLAGVPNLQLRSNNVLRTLTNGLLHTVGKLPEFDTPSEFAQEPLTHMLGRRINKSNGDAPVQNAKANKTDLEALRHKARLLYDRFPDMSVSDILEDNDRIEILAVAKIAGIDISNLSDIKVNASFVRRVQAVITQEKAEEERKQLAQEAHEKEQREKEEEQRRAQEKAEEERNKIKESAASEGSINTEPAAGAQTEATGDINKPSEVSHGEANQSTNEPDSAAGAEADGEQQGAKGALNSEEKKARNKK